MTGVRTGMRKRLLVRCMQLMLVPLCICICMFLAGRAVMAAPPAAQRGATLCFLGAVAFALGLWSRVFAKARQLPTWFSLCFLIGGVVLTTAGVGTSVFRRGPLWPLDEERTYLVVCLICLTPWISGVHSWLTAHRDAVVDTEDEDHDGPAAEARSVPGARPGRQAGVLLVSVQILALASCTFLAASLLAIAGTRAELRETMCFAGGGALAFGLWSRSLVREGRLSNWFRLYCLIVGGALLAASVATAAAWGGPLWPMDATGTYLVLFFVLVSRWEPYQWWLTPNGGSAASGQHRSVEDADQVADGARIRQE